GGFVGIAGAGADRPALGAGEPALGCLAQGSLVRGAQDSFPQRALRVRSPGPGGSEAGEALAQLLRLPRGEGPGFVARLAAAALALGARTARPVADADPGMGATLRAHQERFLLLPGRGRLRGARPFLDGPTLALLK